MGLFFDHLSRELGTMVVDVLACILRGTNCSFTTAWKVGFTHKGVAMNLSNLESRTQLGPRVAR
jgi:hypothetical protein